MDTTSGAVSEPELEFEEWRELIRAVCGRCNPEGVETPYFTGSVRLQNVCGFDAVDLSCSNTDRIERAQRDVRADGMEHFYALMPLAGRSTVIHNDQIAEMGAGDISLIDSTRPVKYVCNNTPGRWLSLHLPRQSLISHLGFVSQAGPSRQGGWTEKEGQLYVQPPVSVLEQLVAIRVHIDDCPVEGGALRVVPKSHLEGRLNKEQAEALRSQNGETVVPVGRGGVLVMRPLLLHASSRATSHDPRRVLHFVFGRPKLPLGLEWRWNA